MGSQITLTTHRHLHFDRSVYPSQSLLRVHYKIFSGSVSEFYPSHGLSSWQGLFAPAGTPQSVIDRLRTATNEVIADKAFDGKLRATLSGKSFRSTPEAFAAQIKSESEKYGALIRALDIKIQ
jgi:hypothetical protein